MQPWQAYLDTFQYTGDQLRQHIWERATVCFQREAAEKDAITSVAAYESRRAALRQHFLAALGGLPAEKTPLNVQLRGAIERPGYRIEKLIYESQPSFHVTASLYVPAGLTAPRPAVLYVCGHHALAKAAPRYQAMCQALVRAGFVVLAIDPLGQGERLYYYNPVTGRPDIQWCTEEHSHAGFQCTLTGTNIARYFVWDEIRGVDLLTARPEVDACRIGVTGTSGGGTQTNLLTMADDRIAAAASCCYTNERQAYMHTAKYHDAEQNLYGAVAQGLNFDDMLGAIAPKPVQICAVASDFFPIHGALKTYERLQRTYALYGAVQNVRMVIDSGPHLLTPVHVREVVAFFRRHLAGEDVDLGPALAVAAGPQESPIPANIEPLPPTPPVEVEEPKTLNCTATGQIVAEFGARTRSVYQLNLAHWQEWKAAYPVRNPACVRQALHRHIRAERRYEPIWARCTASGGGDDAPHWQHVFFYSEPGIAVSAVEMRSPGVSEDAPLTVAVLDEGTSLLQSAPAEIQPLVDKYGRLLLFDPRGIGAVAQNAVCPQRDSHGYGGTYHSLNYQAIMLGDSLFAMRAFDIDRVLEYAHRISPVVSGYARGNIGLCLLAAAALRQEPIHVELENCPDSWEYYVQERLFVPPYSYEVFGVLRDFDVPDLIALIQDAGGSVVRN